MADMEGLIRLYFPSSQVANAICISHGECGSAWNGNEGRCIGQEPSVNCDGSPSGEARYSYGPFQIFESCWDPALNTNSPFTHEQWAGRMDPNVNTWMASYLFSRSGWGIWSTCRGCGVCDVGPEPINYPNGPIVYVSPQPDPLPISEPMPAPMPVPPSDHIMSGAPAGSKVALVVSAVMLGATIYMDTRK
jgi:hypothetical protein